jgi:hypothetical protein
MTTLVTRLYDSADRAQAAVKELTAKGFRKDLVTVATDAAALTASRVPADAVQTYAAALAGGGAVVAAQCPAGTSFAVRNLLDSYGPKVSGVAEEEVFLKTVDPLKVRERPRERYITRDGRTTRDMGVHLLTGVRMSGNPWLLMTGTRWSGNKMLLMTGSRWSGNKLFKSDARWCGNNKLLMTGTFWGGWGRKLMTGARMGGNPWLLATGTRWSGNNSLLMTGTRWGGPFSLIWRT